MMAHVCTPHAVYIDQFVTVYDELSVVCQTKLIKKVTCFILEPDATHSTIKDLL